MIACVLLHIVFVIDQPRTKPPPLTAAQRARLVKLVQTTRKRAEELKTKLEQRQNELTRLYAEFELDVKKVADLQKEIVTLQKDLLANYHHMQVELRSIVGRERFMTLRKRLANVLGVNGPKEQPKRPKKTNQEK